MTRSIIKLNWMKKFANGPVQPMTETRLQSRFAALYLGRLLLASTLAYFVPFPYGNAATDFDDLAEVKILQKGMPKDVAGFVSKSAECSHWGGEDPYDKERAEFIINAARKAGCSKLFGDKIHLRRKYRKNPKVIETIEKAKNLSM